MKKDPIDDLMTVIDDDLASIRIKTDEIIFIVCCDCGLRHAYHFHVVRGKKPEDDAVHFSIQRDELGTQLLKEHKRKGRKRRC